MALNVRQQAFVAEYSVDHNATKAAIRAGYSANGAGQTAFKLLKNAQIQAAINRGLASRIQSTEISVASITARLMTIADKAQSIDGPSGLNVARQSVMDVAKLNGLVVDTHETVSRSAEERKVRLHELQSERERLTRTH